MEQDTILLKIVDRIDDEGNILQLTLKHPDGRPLPPFDAGAHLDIHVRQGDIDVWRQYSLCGDPEEADVYRLGILKNPNSRGGSATIHEIARPGLEIMAKPPRNHFPLSEDAAKSLLIGGGIGITPMLAMAHRLSKLGKDFEVHYCTRSRRSTAFLRNIEGMPFNNCIHFHHDDEKSFDPEILPPPHSGTHVYVCGPQGFMDWLVKAAMTAGYPAEQIHREYFSADIDATGKSFEVEAQASGVTVTVGPEETIARALAKAGIPVDVKCEEGICGTCLTEVVDGVPDHRDLFLTDAEKAENTEIMICCSRAKSKKLILNI